MTHGAGHELQQQLHQATRNLTREMNKAPDAVRILQVKKQDLFPLFSPSPFCLHSLTIKATPLPPSIGGLSRRTGG